MFKSKILFILGAGSSAEVGLPYGEKFKEKIEEKLSIRFDDSGFRPNSVHAQEMIQTIKEYAGTEEEPEINIDDSHIKRYLDRAHQLIDALIQASSIGPLVGCSQR